LSNGSEALAYRLSGVLVEPRYALNLNSDRVFAYIAGRLAYSRENIDRLVMFSTGSSANLHDDPASGLGYGFGGGMLLRLSATINADAGLAIFKNRTAGTSYEGYDEAGRGVPPGWSYVENTVGYAAKVGLSIGLRKSKQ
jgi:hypothetical protein